MDLLLPFYLTTDIVIPEETNTLGTTSLWVLCMLFALSKSIICCFWCLTEGKGLANFFGDISHGLFYSSLQQVFFLPLLLFGIPLIWFVTKAFVWRVEIAAPSAFLWSHQANFVILVYELQWLGHFHNFLVPISCDCNTCYCRRLAVISVCIIRRQGYFGFKWMCQCQIIVWLQLKV